MKKIVLLLVIIMFQYVNKSNAGCPHCYTTAKVILKWHNENVDTGYVPIFYFHNNFWKANREKNLIEVNILPYLKSKNEENIIFKSFQFSKKFYLIELDRPQAVFPTEYTIKIETDSINQIILLGWEKDINGAGSFDLLSIKYIKKIFDFGFKNYIIHQLDVSDLILINTNQNVNKPILSCLADNIENLQEWYDIDHVINKLRNPVKSKKYYVKLPLGDFVEQTIQEANRTIETVIKNISLPCDENELNQIYINIFKKKYLKSIEIYSYIHLYLFKNESEQLYNFITSEINDIEKRQELIEIIKNQHKMTANKIILKLNKALEEYLQINKWKTYLEVLNLYGIITYFHNWD